MLLYIKLEKINATIVLLKEYSPSCGSLMIYNGEFIGKKLEGMGVTSALLKRSGLKVISEEQFVETFFSKNFQRVLADNAL